MAYSNVSHNKNIGATTSASSIKLSPTNSESTSSTDSQNTKQSKSSDYFSSSLWINQINPNLQADKYANPTVPKYAVLNNESRNGQTALAGILEAGKQMIAGITNITGVLSKVAEGANNAINKSKNGQNGEEGNDETKDTKATSLLARGNTDLFKRD